MTRRIAPKAALACVLVLLLPAAACPDPTEVPVLERRQDREHELAATNAEPPEETDLRIRMTGLEMSNSVGGAAQPAPAPIQCSRGGLCRQLSAPISSGVDLLFVVDNSGSMRQEQASLQEQFPRMIQMLTSGERSDGSVFSPARDVHLGVVSTDMGLIGLSTNFPGCNTEHSYNGGDDGVLQHRGIGADCASTYPPFLEYTADRDDPEKLARDFGCITNLGTSGCGFEQPLEAALKALWPMSYTDSNGNTYPPESNPLQFLSVTPQGRYGHGDLPPTAGGNGGFARNDPSKGLSLLAVVVVSDEDDCSSRSLEHFTSTNDPANPLSKQGLNLRCFYNKQNLFAVERYTLGLRSVRPNHQDTIRFAALVGVPPDLVDAEAREAVDFEDATSREAFYDRILKDRRMRETPQNEHIPALANVAPSCERVDLYEQKADAYPPRRIVEVAKGFGRNGLVQSICQDDFGPAIDGVVDMMARDVAAQCLPSPLKRSDGKVQCDVIVENASCDAPYLQTVEGGGASGETRCKVAQLPVREGRVGSGEGFYYDDFSEPARKLAEKDLVCGDGSGALITFTQEARPAPGVRVYLDCDKSAQD
jgi:hypothetical protein